MNEQEARTIVETLRVEHPDVYRLAQVVSLAVRIEPELLRRARLRLLPEIDAGAEADLWFSSLVQSQGPLAMTFLPGITEVLREHLVRDQSLLTAAWKLLEEFHQNAPPALRLEEEVTWLALSSSDNSDLIRKRLESVAAAIVSENRPGLVQWATRALPTLPGKARDSDAAHVLSLVATVPASLMPPSSSGSVAINERLAQLIARGLPRAPIGVRLLKQDVQSTSSEIEATEVDKRPRSEPMLFVEFSYPPPPALDAWDVIDVPQTDPVLIEVSWRQGDRRHVQRISIKMDQTTRVEVGSRDVSLRTALGDLHNLRQRIDYDLFLHYNLKDREFAESLITRLKEEEYNGHKLRAYLPVISGGPYQSVEGTFEIPFRLSRKVGLVMSPESVEKDWRDIKEFAAKRIDSSRIREWIIPIYHRPCEVPFELRNVTTIDLGLESNFESGYQRLVAAIAADLPSDVPGTRPSTEQVATPSARTNAPARIFLSYSRKDKKYVDEFAPHLQLLLRENLVSEWHDEMIAPGVEWSGEIRKELDDAGIILLFVSPDFLASDFLNQEMNLAIEKHRAGETIVLPVIVRSSVWTDTPLGKLQGLPRNARPITEWRRRDEAYVDIVNSIRNVIEPNRVETKRRGSADQPKPAIYRWAVRTATDQDTDKINSTVVITTIKALSEQPRPTDMPLKTVRAPAYQTRRASPVETTRWAIDSEIIAYKRQTSGGYRLTFRDPDGATMIAIAQDPRYASQPSPLANEMATVVRKLTSRFKFGPSYVKTDVRARVVGLGFFNRWHAHSVGAPNGVELQPLLQVDFFEEKTPTSSSLKPHSLTLEVNFRGLSGSDTGINQKELLETFVRLNPDLTLTVVLLSKPIRGRMRLLARVEGTSDRLRYFPGLARQAVEKTIAQMRPPREAVVSFFESKSLKEPRSPRSRPKSKAAIRRKAQLSKKSGVKKGIKKR